MLNTNPGNIRRNPTPHIPLKLQAVTLDDPFWSPRFAQWRTLTVNDVFNKFETAGALENFRRVAQGQAGGHIGPPFIDGLFYETLRAASDFLASKADTALLQRLQRYIELIIAAQDAVGDGYINTRVTLMYPEQRWGANGGDQLMNHEEYNAGCLVEAGVHYYLVTGDTRLLRAGIRFADHMCAVIGPPPRRNIVPSHPLAEEALVKLYQLLTDEPGLAAILGCREAPDAYLELVRFWMDHRGNHQGRASFGEYAQDHIPLADQPEAVGHAVRATLLYTGLAAFADQDSRTADDSTLQRLWHDVVDRKMFITGGVGPVKDYEGFGPPYFLPTSGYIETCAGVGLAFWANRMSRIYPATGYIDIYERVIYNVVLAGISLDGTHYSYENPLLSQGKMHRWAWHGCPCCPPMLLKLYSELPGFIIVSADDDIIVNLYIGCRAQVTLPVGTVQLDLETQYPWQETANLSLHMSQPADFRINLRIPGWCRAFTVSINDQLVVSPEITDGYAVLAATWHDNDVVSIKLEMPIERIAAHPAVSDLYDRVSVQRGPLVYCLEGVDNPGESDPLLPAEVTFKSKYEGGLLDGVVTITAPAIDGSQLSFVPYFAWDNRATGNPARDWLRVWLRQQGMDELRAGVDKLPGSWDSSLYQPLPA